MKTCKDTVFLNQWVALEAELIASPFKMVMEAMKSIQAFDLERRTARKQAEAQIAAINAEYEFQRKIHENL